MRIIAGQTPDYTEYDVFVDGKKIERCFEADDVENKAWVHADNFQGYEVLKGKVEFKKKVTLSSGDQQNVNQQSETRGVYGGILAGCIDPNCPCQYCGDGVTGDFDIMFDDGGFTIRHGTINPCAEIAAEFIDEPCEVEKIIDEYYSPREITLDIQADTSKFDEALEKVKESIGKEIEIIGAMINDGEYVFGSPIVMQAGDTLQLNFEVTEDMSIEVVKVIKKLNG